MIESLNQLSVHQADVIARRSSQQYVDGERQQQMGSLPVENCWHVNPPSPVAFCRPIFDEEHYENVVEL
jgi:hypothetical protein